MQKNSAQRAERRRHGRFTIDLEVYVSHGGARARPYRMRDYCQSGVFLEAVITPEERGTASASPLPVDQLVEVSGNMCDSQERESFRFTAQVVRLVEQGFGARFQQPEARVLSLLRKHAQNAPIEQVAPQPHRGPEPRKAPLGRAVTTAQVEGMLRQFAEENFTEPLHSVIERIEIELLGRSNKSAKNAEEHRVFNDLSGLDLAKSVLNEYLLQPLLNRAMQGYRGVGTVADEDIKASELTLVDQEEFEKWVQVVKSSSRLSDIFSELLHELLEMIQTLPRNDNPLGEVEVPFSPLQIMEELNRFSARLDLGPLSFQLLLQEAVQVLGRDLGKIYNTLKSALRDLGAQPNPRAKPRNPLPGQAIKSPDTTSFQQSSRPATAAPLAIDTRPRADSTNATPATVATSTRTAPPASLIGATDLARLVPQLHADAVAGPPGLQERLRQMAAGSTPGSAELKPVAKERAEFAGQLLDFMDSDQRLSAKTAPWLQAIQVPLVRAVLTDPGFFRSKNHPALKLIDRLEHLGSFINSEQDSAEQAHLRTSIERVMARLRQGEGDENTLVEVAEGLSELTIAQSGDYQRHVERLVAASAGQDRLQLSRIQVREELDRRYGSRQVPAVALQLLDVGWRALMELACLRQGRNAPEYHRCLGLFDETVRQLGGKPYEDRPSPLKRTDLVTAFEEGLSSTSFDPLHRAQVLEWLKSGLLNLEGETRSKARKLIQFPVTTDKPADTDLEQKKDIPESAWLHAMQKVKSIQIGDRINFVDAQGETLFLRLAWISDVNSRLTLVNQQGLRAKELSQAELARFLHFHQATTTPAEQTMLSERAIQSMFKRMEDRLSYHTSHDSLTGLYNRPQFQSALEQALNKDGDGASQVLCWMNLDNFAVFNDSCGYEVGDKLLVTVAGMLEQHFGELGVLGHLGGDKFGALLDNCSSQRGTHLAETFRSAVERIPFYWNGRSMPVSISVALVDLAEAGDSLTQLMQAADAALSAAKQARGNQVYRYDALDHKIREQRESMQWMLQVNQALDHGRLKLRCQKISPIDPGKGFSPHYEVLLGVTDESGKSLHIGNFISAAEKYNRMAQVDRWVVRTAISWVAEQKPQLPGLGGFAINLSGHTLNDESFIAFVDELFRKTQLPPEYISFEVTETLAIANLDRARRIIHALKDMGCTFALDDFGSGLSSYSYLKVLPVDYLKIDGAFVKDIHADQNNYAVVKSINEIAHFMGKRTIAEYVENVEILRCLAEIGVDYAQGYGIEKPRLLEDLTQGA